jgi:hypothetical protein
MFIHIHLQLRIQIVMYTHLTLVGCVGTSYTVSATPLKAVTALPLLTVTAADITGQLATGVTLLQCMYILLSDIIAAVVPVAGSIIVTLAVPNVAISVAVAFSLQPPVLTSVVLKLTTTVKPVAAHCTVASTSVVLHECMIQHS